MLHMQVTYKQHRKEKLELAEHLLRKKADIDLPILTQVVNLAII